jgi:hypothetical protein
MVCEAGLEPPILDIEHRLDEPESSSDAAHSSVTHGTAEVGDLAAVGSPLGDLEEVADEFRNLVGGPLRTDR